MFLFLAQPFFSFLFLGFLYNWVFSTFLQRFAGEDRESRRGEETAECTTLAEKGMVPCVYSFKRINGVFTNDFFERGEKKSQFTIHK